MKGQILQWNDDKGFGFIVSEDGDERVFFHISAVNTRSRRPQVSDIVLYEAIHDSEGRLKAKEVVIEGVSSGTGIHREKKILTEPPKKDALDYLSIALLLGVLAGAVFAFVETGNIEKTIPILAILIIPIALLNRQKKPKEKSFTCARCKKISQYDKRTVKAWNNGSLKLYCSVCHQQWLTQHPRESQQGIVNSRGRGCLGVAFLLVMLPLVACIAAYQWFV
jgi:cold shock CspA family protein